MREPGLRETWRELQELHGPGPRPITLPLVTYEQHESEGVVTTKPNDDQAAAFAGDVAADTMRATWDAMWPTCSIVHDYMVRCSKCNHTKYGYNCTYRETGTPQTKRQSPCAFESCPLLRDLREEK